MQEYRKLTEVLLADFQRKTVEKSVYALDFHDVGTYMLIPGWDLTRFHFVSRILESPPEDDQLTMLPPSIFEMLRHYCRMGAKVSWLKEYRNLENYPRIGKFLASKAKPVALLKTYREMGGLRSLLDLAVGPAGYNAIVGRPIDRLLSLVNKEKISPLPFDSFSYDPIVEARLLKRLNDERSAKEYNNQVDADVGSIVYKLIDDHYPEYYTNAVTYSQIPFEAYFQETPPTDPEKMPIVRDTMYLAARSLVKNSIPDDEERIDTLNKIAGGFKTFESGFEKTMRSISKQFKVNRDEFLPWELDQLSTLMTFFIYDYGWAEALRESAVSIRTDRKLMDKLEFPTDPHAIELLEEMQRKSFSEVKQLHDVLTDRYSYSSAMAKAEEDLSNDLGKLYRRLYDFVANFDGLALSQELDEMAERISVRHW